MSESDLNGRERLLGIGLAFIALIAGVYAMGGGQRQEIVFMHQSMTDMKSRLVRLEDRERAVAAPKSFEEVEEQFSAIGLLMAAEHSALEQRIEDQERDGNPRHDERIKNLELRLDGQGGR